MKKAIAAVGAIFVFCYIYALEVALPRLDLFLNFGFEDLSLAGYLIIGITTALPCVFIVLLMDKRDAANCFSALAVYVGVFVAMTCAFDFFDIRWTAHELITGFEHRSMSEAWLVDAIWIRCGVFSVLGFVIAFLISLFKGKATDKR